MKARAAGPWQEGRTVSTEAEKAELKRRATRAARYALLDAARLLTDKPALQKCRRLRHGGAREGITVNVSAEGVGGFGGLQTCASVWACPCCSPNIRQKRADELAVAVGRHLAAGGGVYFATATIRHRRADPLERTLGVTKGAWRSLQSGREWMEAKETYGIVGIVKADEITYGVNGWHPHVHALIFTKAPLGEDSQAALSDAMWSRWSAYATRKGCSPTRLRGWDWQACAKDGKVLAHYVSKLQDGGLDRPEGPSALEGGRPVAVGMELARSDLKRGRKSSRTPFEILGLAAAGDRQAMALWREYVDTTAGRNALTWSKGLKARLLVAEQGDEELAADLPGVRVAVLSDLEWRLVLGAPGARSRVLDAAERSGADGVSRVLLALVKRQRRAQKYKDSSRQYARRLRTSAVA